MADSQCFTKQRKDPLSQMATTENINLLETFQRFGLGLFSV